ncbi:MAG: acyltransferase [Prevotella sp.]|jgi:surface polysaccharide O-acyltransferase-like enzyme|nr:acyltransferase [Prevotella sp.]
MERNVTLDYFKVFLSILVIIIHLQPLLEGGGNAWLLGWLLSNGIARIAVPCFFIINGYYISNQISDGKFVKKYILRCLLLYAVWTLIYGGEYSHFSLNRTLLFLTTGFFHLWYMVALIMGTALFFCLKKLFKNDWILLCMAVLLVVSGYFVQKYGFLSINDYSTRLTFYRNFLFVGFPFLFFGYFIRANEKKIMQFKTQFLFFLLVVSSITLIVEACLTEGGYPYDIFLSLPVLCSSLFLLVLKYSSYSVSDGYMSKFASGIYFVHLLVIAFVRYLLGHTSVGIIILPEVLFLSMALSAGIIALNKRMRLFL